MSYIVGVPQDGGTSERGEKNMNEKTATAIADLLGGEAKAVNSGGGVFIVELRDFATCLCLGNGGWWIEDEGGEHLIDGENLD